MNPAPRQLCLIISFNSESTTPEYAVSNESQVACRVGFCCEIRPQGFYEQIKEGDFIAPIAQIVEAIWKQMQNWLANYTYVYRN